MAIQPIDDENAFRAWLSDYRHHNERLVDNTIARCRRINRDLGDIRVAYDTDRCAHMLSLLTYTIEDADNHRVAPGNLVFKGDQNSEAFYAKTLREGLATLQKELNVYCQFRESGQRNERNKGETMTKSEVVGVTQVKDLAAAVARDWTGCDLDQFCTSRQSLWDTAICANVCPRYKIDEDGGLLGTDLAFFAGARLGDEKDNGELAGVLVWLHDSYGNVVIHVDAVGMSENELSYYSQFNEGVQIPILVRRIRAVVETAAQEFTKEMSRFNRAMIPVTEISSEEVQDLVNKLRQRPAH